MIYRLVRPVLFRLDPERAHALSLALLRLAGAFPPARGLLRRAFTVAWPDPVRVAGVAFPNPVGLAAGYDKDAVAWRGLGCLGLGHVEVGTVTPRPQPGNPPPRVFRLPEDRSLVNRLGFPGRGADFVLRRLGGPRDARDPVLGVNVGKQRGTPPERAVEDYEGLVDRFAPVADYLAVNVSSPNTPGLRDLQQRAWLEPLLRRLAARRDAQQQRLGRRVPVLVKLSPDLDESQLEEAVGAIVETGMDGVIATNTTTSREGLRSPHAVEAGGLSGAALTLRSTECVRQVRKHAGRDLPVVACGGVMHPEDARAKLEAGADLLQIYTGLVYEGPALVRRILRDGGVREASRERRRF